MQQQQQQQLQQQQLQQQQRNYSNDNAATATTATRGLKAMAEKSSFQEHGGEKCARLLPLALAANPTGL
jgi:hypothetical protein